MILAPVFAATALGAWGSRCPKSLAEGSLGQEWLEPPGSEPSTSAVSGEPRGEFGVTGTLQVVTAHHTPKAGPPEWTGLGAWTHRPRSVALSGRGRPVGSAQSPSHFWEDPNIVYSGQTVVCLMLLLLMERIAPNHPLLQPRIPVGTELLPWVEMDP